MRYDVNVACAKRTGLTPFNDGRAGQYGPTTSAFYRAIAVFLIELTGPAPPQELSRRIFLNFALQ